MDVCIPIACNFPSKKIENSSGVFVTSLLWKERQDRDYYKGVF